MAARMTTSMIEESAAALPKSPYWNARL